MATCLMCKKDVTTGFVVCGDCAKELKADTLPHILDYYIARLAAKIAFDDTVYPCPMCEMEDCRLGEPGVTKYECHKGISDWLRSKANEFFTISGRGILGRLKTVCPFPEVFADTDETDGPGRGQPRRKIGHIRADYDQYRWWSTVWSSHWDLATADVKAEIDSTYEALTAKDALHDLNALRRFCWLHPEAQYSQETDDEFNFYLVGKTCDFWVRLITRDKDYNMYLNVYAKAAQGQEAQ